MVQPVWFGVQVARLAWFGAARAPGGGGMVFPTPKKGPALTWFSAPGDVAPPDSWVGGGPEGAPGSVTPSGAGSGAAVGLFAAHTPRTKRILGRPKVWLHPEAR